MVYGQNGMLLTGVTPLAVCTVVANQCCVWWVQWLNTALLAIIAVLLVMLLRQMYKQAKGQKELN